MAAWRWIPSLMLSGRAQKFWWQATPCSAAAIQERMPRSCCTRLRKQRCRRCSGAQELRAQIDERNFSPRSYVTSNYIGCGAGDGPAVGDRLHQQEVGE